VRQVKAPDQPNAELRIFLAGSIEMGEAEQWQRQVVDALADVDNLLILNPRRDDWDSSWEQQAANAQFVEQVNWELDMLDAADIIVMYFAPDTMSPISLLELGLYAKSGKLRVCCPSSFWRSGNVEVVCQRHGIPLFDDLEELLASLHRTIRLA
jgi:Nucleoside 2-deoxyribosyltransferase like